MAELKTKLTKQKAADFIKSVQPDQKREDSQVLLKMFEKATGEKAAMWGDGIVGFGSFHYKSERSSQQGDWPLISFSPRKASLTLYVMQGIPKSDPQLKKLGKFKTSGGCLYINKLADVDQKVLASLVAKSYKRMKKTWK